MTAPQVSDANSDSWKSIIRLLAVIMAVFGLVIMGHEILENISTCNAGNCARMHLGTMMWGIALSCLGMLILQRGDVSLSIRDAVSAGSIVRGWFTRSGRSTDPEGTVVTTVIEEPKPVPPPHEG